MSRLSVPNLNRPPAPWPRSMLKSRRRLARNSLATIGAYGPAALAVLAVDSALASGTRTKRDQETIEPVISAVAGGDYCVAAHSLLGKLAGLKPHDLKIRNGEPTGDVKRDALARFVRTLAETRCTVSDDDFAAIKAAGYTDAQLSSPTSSTASTTPRSTSQQSRKATASV